MALNNNLQNFLLKTCQAKGFRFAVELHSALSAGKADPSTRAQLRAALAVVRSAP